jgi:hypothetical protein
MVFVLPVAASAQSADPYTEKLQAGDAKSAAGDRAGAAADYEAAVADAQTPTQRALALGKKARARPQENDYAGARAAADSALRVKRREEACMLGTPEVERKNKSAVRMPQYSGKPAPTSVRRMAYAQTP